MNILTFDIEEWFLWEKWSTLSSERHRVFDSKLGQLLDLLDLCGIKATFFCVGMMGKRFPDVIRKIKERGHEIGCHSNTHAWLNKMSREECFEDTRIAVDSIEQCTGEKVFSYRAPAFSVGEENQWVFEVLAQNGITRDSSVFPAKRDFGGFPSFGKDTPSLISCGGKTIKEFPISATSLLGYRTAFSGGGYFRFFPLWFILSRMKKRDYNICYFHIADFVKEERMSKAEYEAYFMEKAGPFSTYVRYVKTNLGRGKSWKKLSKTIKEQEFMSLEEADRIQDWDTAPTALDL